jgi:HEAT repeat protein
MEKEGQTAGGPPAEAGQALAKALEEMLVGLRRTSKDLTFYPPEHPLLRRSLERATGQVRALVADRSPLALVVGRSGFTFEGRAVGAENRQLASMANELFVKRIQKMYFVKEVTIEELVAFLRMISSDPKQLFQDGGPAKVLAAHGVHRIQVNEFDFRRLSVAAKPAAAEGGPETATQKPSPSAGAQEPETAGDSATAAAVADKTEPAEAVTSKEPEAAEPERPTVSPQKDQTIEALLERLEREAAEGGVAGYEWAASRLEAASARAVRDKVLSDLLPILQAFLRHRQAEEVKAALKERATKAVEIIAAENTVPFLVEHLVSEGDEAAGVLSSVIVALGARAIPLLVERLGATGERAAQERLLDILARYLVVDQPALTHALQAMGRDRAAQLAPMLGEIGGEASVGVLLCILQHREARVRREVVRALGRIGGPAIHRPLIQALRESDPTVLEVVVGALGAAKVKLATPALLRFAGQRVLAGKPFAIRKAALTALGSMGDPGVVPTLTTVLYTRTWFHRAAGDELRQAAAMALLGTARPEGRELVEKGARSRRRDVRRACNAALRRVTTPPATKA